MEGHPFAQLEFPGGFVDRLPGGCQAGLQPLLLVLQHQRLEDVAPHGVVRAEVVIVRIEGRGLGRDGDGQILCGSR